jgi:hypothetical protein
MREDVSSGVEWNSYKCERMIPTEIVVQVYKLPRSFVRKSMAMALETNLSTFCEQSYEASYKLEGLCDQK